MAAAARCAKAPLPDMAELLDLYIPGTPLLTEGLLKQMSDDEMVSIAYTLKQLTEKLSTKLIQELESRDELKSMCLHRREYVQLLNSQIRSA